MEAALLRELGASFPRPRREDLVTGRERDAARAVEVAPAAPDGEHVETRVVADLRARDDMAVERAALGDRVLHEDLVGFTQRDGEDRVHLLFFLDEPHELLRGVTDL